MGRPRGPFVFWGESVVEGGGLGVVGRAVANLKGLAAVCCHMNRVCAALIIPILALIATMAQASYPHRATGTAWARPGLHGPQARLMAERGAQVVAARNLMAQEQMGHYHATPGYRHLSGTIGGYRYSPTRYLPDGRAIVAVQREWGR